MLIGKLCRIVFSALIAVAIPAAMGETVVHGEDKFASPEVSPLSKLKALYPDTTLVDSGQPSAVLIVPDGDEHRKAAVQFIAAIQSSTSVRLEILRPEEVVNENWQVDHAKIGPLNLIAMGNVNTNRLLAALWGAGYVAADSLYPGKDGYVVRTVHDPFATGINVLVLAGSDAVGVEKAVATFATNHIPKRCHSLVISGPIVDVENHPVEHPLFPQARSMVHPQNGDLQGAQRLLKKAGFMNQSGDILSHKNQKLSRAVLTSQLAGLAETYFFTGNEALVPLMKTLVDKNRQLLANPTPLLGMHSLSAKHVQGWDLIEELPIWDDHDRLAITNALLGDAKAGHEKRYWHRAVRDGAVQALDENHGTFSAYHSFLPWVYFHKYYQISASDYWMRAADAVFSAQSSTFQILEDGSTYLGFSPAVNNLYAFRKPDLTYLQRGIAREHARYIALACMNNLGYTTGFGDTANVKATTAFGCLGPAAWYYRDPYLNWIIQNKLPADLLATRYQKRIPVNLDIRPEEPAGWTGVTRFPIYESPLAETKTSTTPVFGERVELEPELFNKIVFKENWDDEGQYLLLDGAGQWGDGPGPHGHKHDDINTIINYSDRGRMWLVDHTYADRAFASHTGAFLSHTGSIPYSKTELARLEHFVENDSFAMTQTTLGGWTRKIYWKKGSYFLVVDKLIADQDGEYVARCNFKGLGEPTLEGTTLLLEQQGRYCRIQGCCDAKPEVVDIPFANKGIWDRDYRYAKPVPRMFRQDKVVRLKEGESVTFVNLIHAGASKQDLDQITLDSISGDTVLVREKNLVTLLGAGELPGGTGQAAMYMVSRQDSLTTNAAETLNPRDVRNAIFAAEKLIDSKPSRREAKATEQVHGFQIKSVDVASPISLLESVDLDHDGKEEWLVGGGEGIRLYSTQGELHWSFETPFGIRSLAAGDLDGDGKDEIVFGGDGQQIQALTRLGKRLWSFTCQGAHASKFGKPNVDFIRIIDLDRNGKNEVVIGAHWIHVLSGDGSLHWEQSMKMARNMIQGDFVDADISDIDGDGQLDISAAFKSGYSVVRTVDPKGQCLMPLQFRGRFFGLQNVAEHQGLTVGSPVAVRTVSLPSPNQQQRLVACATQRSLNVYWHDQQDKYREYGIVDGTFTALEAVTTGPDENPALVLANDLYGVTCYEVLASSETRKIKLRPKWYRTLDASISTIKTADLDRDGIDEVYVGTIRGVIYGLNSVTGETMGTAMLPGIPVVSLTTNNDQHALLIAQQEGLVTILQLDSD